VAEEEEDDGRERLVGGGNGPGPNPIRSKYQPTSRSPHSSTQRVTVH
jgi:hypothetical protein